MPLLTWESKAPPTPLPSDLKVDSLIYPQGLGYPDSIPQSQLILGDNLAVMWALLPEYEGSIDLIYADPPFFTNRHYPARVGRGEDSRRPQEWLLAEGYPDHWTSLEAYLDMLYPRLVLMHRLLSPTGTLYLHLDWHANSYARLLLDEIFGAERLLNEIVWIYHGPSPIRSAFNRKHDTLLVYTKSPEYTFNVDAVRQPYDPTTLKTFASSPKAGFGKIPNLERGKVPEDWWYFPVVARLHSERTGYPTQKPQGLLARILQASSNPGDLVADFFCGSGTTAAAAAQAGRKFIATDAAWRAVHTTYTRLVKQHSQPFTFKVETHSVHLEPTAAEPQQATLADGRVSIHASTLSQLDSWEVDPAWDRQIFRSAIQATRPQRDGTIQAHLHLPEVAQATCPVAIRMTHIDGARSQHILQR